MLKLIKWLLILAVIVIVVGVALPFVLPVSFVKGQVETLVTQALGRKFAIDGDLSYTLWPPLTLKAANVSLANRPDESEAVMARFDQLDIDLKALAYKDDVVEIGHVRLIKPVAHLSIDENGNPNWEMGEGSDDRGRSDGRGPGPDHGDGLPKLVLGEIVIEDGLVTFEDRQAGIERRFENIQLSITGDEQSGALNIAGSVDQGGEQALLQGQVADLNALAGGGSSDLNLNLTVPGGEAGITGKLDAGAGGLDVEVDLQIEDIRGLASWAGQPLELPEGQLEALSLKAGVTGNGQALDLAPLALQVDDLAINGDLALALNERLRISGSLALGNLNLDPYLPPRDDAAAPAAEATDSTEPQGWPNDPLNLPLPLPVDLDLVLEIDAVRADKVELGKGKIELFADNLTTKVNVVEQILYDGAASALLTAEAGEEPKFDASLKADGVALFPILKAFAEFERLEGTGNIDVSVQTQGNSVKTLVERLDGSGNVMFSDGAILGINIGATVRSVMTLGVSNEAKQQKRTDFAELGGSFVIEQGLLKNDDLALRAPLLRVNGAGRVDLSAQTLNYVLTPKLASTLEGQDASTDPNFNLGVPIVFEGPWSDPDFQLEIGGALTGDITDPAALADVIGGIAQDEGKLQELQEQFGSNGGGFGGLIDGLLGGSNQEQPADSNPVDNSQQENTVPDATTGNPVDAPKKLIDSLGGLLGND